MAAATNTTLGEIKLSGDLLASNANAPTLRPSGVKSGTYNVTDKIYVDAQGRITWAKQLPGDFTWPVATKTSYGIFQIGVTPDPNNNSIDISSGVIGVNKATATDAGVVKIGSGLLINGTSDATEVNVPEATTLVFGACRPDNTTTEVDVNGTLSINGQALIDDAGPASASNLGAVKVGARFSITDGVLDTDWNLATGATLGTVIVGDNFSVNAGVLSANAASTTVNGVMQPAEPSFWIDTNDNSIHIRQTHYAFWGHLYGISGPNIFLDDPTSTLSCNYSFSDFSGDATTSVLGKVQVGDRIDVDGNGVISVPLSSGSVHGVFKVAGRTFKVVNNALTYDRNYPASATYYGHVKPDGNTIVFSDQPTSTIATNLSAFPNASTTAKGYVQVGSGLAVTSGVLSIPNATESTAGAIQVGSGLTINNGTLSLNIPDATTSSKGAVQIGTQYLNTQALTVTNGILDLKVANTIISGEPGYGVMQPGGGLAIDVNGTLSFQVEPASASYIGAVKPDNTTIKIDQAIIRADNAKQNVLGLVKVGNGFNVGTNGAVNRPLASTSEFGVAQLGSNFYLSTDSELTTYVKDSSDSIKGVMQVGNGLLESSGTISLNYGPVAQVNENSFYSSGQFFAPKTYSPSVGTVIGGNNMIVIDLNPANVYVNALTTQLIPWEGLTSNKHEGDFAGQKVYILYKVKHRAGAPITLKITGTSGLASGDSPIVGTGDPADTLYLFEFMKTKAAGSSNYHFYFKSVEKFS